MLISTTSGDAHAWVTRRRQHPPVRASPAVRRLPGMPKVRHGPARARKDLRAIADTADVKLRWPPQAVMRRFWLLVLAWLLVFPVLGASTLWLLDRLGVSRPPEALFAGFLFPGVPVILLVLLVLRSSFWAPVRRVDQPSCSR